MLGPLFKSQMWNKPLQHALSQLYLLLCFLNYLVFRSGWVCWILVAYQPLGRKRQSNTKFGIFLAPSLYLWIKKPNTHISKHPLKGIDENLVDNHSCWVQGGGGGLLSLNGPRLWWKAYLWRIHGRGSFSLWIMKLLQMSRRPGNDPCNPLLKWCNPPRAFMLGTLQM